MMRHQGSEFKPSEVAFAVITCALVVAFLTVIPWSYGKAYQAGYDKAVETGATEYTEVEE